jgi:uncharacterized protein (TIGR01627 family)
MSSPDEAWKKFYSRKMQILPEHIQAVQDVFTSRTNPNVLVFGCGYDSAMWCDSVKLHNGNVTFLEHSPKWAQVAREKLDKHATVHVVDYSTKAKEWRKLLTPDNHHRLPMKLPAAVKDTTWDVIVVDAPIGSKQGRMQSIYAASELATPEHTHVFVDDYDRKIEKAYANQFLAPRFGTRARFDGRNGFAHFAPTGYAPPPGRTYNGPVCMDTLVALSVLCLTSAIVLVVLISVLAKRR